MSAYTCNEFQKKDLKGKDITGKLYLPDKGSEIGLVLGLGILGNWTGLEDVATNLTNESQISTVVLNPPSHDTNNQECTFGNFAYGMKCASDYLRNKHGAKKVIGGGHSGGPIAALFANMGYYDALEKEVINQDTDEEKRKEFQKALAETKAEQTFDGLILAALPRDLREAMPQKYFNPYFIYAAHLFFRWNNRGNKTQYLGKRGKYQWQHMGVDDLEPIKDYLSKALNPHELVDLLDGGSQSKGAYELVRKMRETPKLFLAPGRDIVSFGPQVNNKKKWAKVSEEKLKEQKEKFETLGIVDEDYHIFKDAAHFLNSTDSFELSSLWGLKAPEVQKLMADFIRLCRNISF